MVTTAVRSNIIYSDFRDDFMGHPVYLDLARVTNEDAVKQSIKNILLTDPFERFTDPAFGAGLESYLFENVSPFTELDIKNAIATAINNYEPRANVIDIIVTAIPDQHVYAATIIFSIISNPYPITLNVILTRTR